MPSPNEITVAQLSRLVGTPEAPVIIDVRTDAEFECEPDLVPSARRHVPRPSTALADRVGDNRVVVYCHDGQVTSQGTAAMLRAVGLSAEHLAGGQAAWRKADLPMVPARQIPGTGTANGSLWVTRHRPKIDRIACPWLIRRFVDPQARFMFVAPAAISDVAEKFSAAPFDVEGVFWSHRGDQCSFDTMLDEFQLHGEALDRVAVIIRGADTDRFELAPQCAGLLAFSLGLSRMYRDDLAQLNAGMPFYDALFRWARDATNEGHDWPGIKVSKAAT